MTKLIALVAAGLFVTGTMFAGEHGDCTKQVGNKQGKMACQASLASLNLTPEQQTKMDAVMAEHEKPVVTKRAKGKLHEEAKTILTKEHTRSSKPSARRATKIRLRLKLIR